MKRIQSLLGAHANQFVCDLGTSEASEPTVLPARYKLYLPPGGRVAFGVSDLDLGPYEHLIRLCASAADFDRDDIVEHGLAKLKPA